MTAEIWIWMLKLIHVATISVWVGGLLGLPYLLWQRHGMLAEQNRAEVHRLHRIVRLLHVGLVSPAAVVAIISGTALIFLRDTYAPWFAVKLVFVGVLILAHNFANASITRVFADDPLDGSPASRDTYQRLGGGRALALGLAIAIGSSGILLAVLAKPPLYLGAVAPDLIRPGGLGAVLGDLNPWARP